MSETATVLVSEAKKVKEGNSQRGPWTLFSLIDGNEDRYSFFDHSLFKQAEALQGKRAEIEFEVDDRGKTLKTIKEAPATNGDQPKLGTGEYIKGQTARSDARRMLIRGAHDNATLAALEMLKFYTAREITPELVKATLESFIGFFWDDALRKADLMEDRDIPFMSEYEGK